jgi:hypothetical protein
LAVYLPVTKPLFAWGVVLLRIALRHVSVEATLAELQRNEPLRKLIGIEREAAVPDLGQDAAGDSTALHARRKGEQATKAKIAEGLPQPSSGKKEYLDDQGKVTKVVEWFGYKLHLLVDAKHEVVLACRVTTATAADCKSLPDLIEQGQANLPADRIRTLAYDKAADDAESHRVLNKAGSRDCPITGRFGHRKSTAARAPAVRASELVIKMLNFQF